MAVALAVAVALLATAFVLGEPVIAARFLGASVLLLATLGYAFVLYRIGVRL